MPIGYLWTVAAVSWGVARALTRWRRIGSFDALPALVVSELPFLVGYFLIASTVLAFACLERSFGSPRSRSSLGARWTSREPCGVKSRDGGAVQT